MDVGARYVHAGNGKIDLIPEKPLKHRKAESSENIDFSHSEAETF